MLKKVCLFFAAVSLTLILAGIVAFRPTRWHKVVENHADYNGGYSTTTETYDRRWEFLPLSEWELLPSFSTARGKEGSQTRAWHFGFFALSEDHKVRTFIVKACGLGRS